ncbi:MAG: Glu/Leu/Phe/Val dehydrogenase dimerization domain-containing protein [Acidobacteriota bacterium]
MSDDILPLLQAWDGDGVMVRHDRPTGTWIFIALHSSALGVPTGGTRMKVYSGLRNALRDAMRLAEGMTYKWAGLGMEFGGGKAVLAISRPLDRESRRGLMHRYGTLLTSLRGAFQTGADLGTGADDMADLASKTPHVLGVDRDTGAATDPGPFTARGVLAGLRTAVRHQLGRDDLAGCRVLIQGLGGVGRPLAHLLADAGAELLLCDLDAGRSEALAAQLGGRVVSVDRAYTEPCDVFSPCAVGGILSEDTIATLGCKVVAGSANNQLLEEDDADRLRKWGILYVPDYIVNAGGAMAFSLMTQGLTDHDELARRVETIGDAVAGILREASDSDTSPLQTARRRVDRLLAAH